MRWYLLILLVLSGLFVAGCEKPLFPETLPRTQYERFDRIRGTHTPKQQIGPSGVEQPALRERLTPYN